MPSTNRLLIAGMDKECMSRAFVFMNCDTSSENDIVKRVRRISGVFNASRLSGVYNIVADLRAESEKDIAKTVRAFGSIESIHSSLTMIVSEENDMFGRRLQ